MSTDILHDERTITQIWFGTDYWIVGFNDVTKIESYEEHGGGSMVTWFAVYVGDEEIRYRVPAHSMNVEYAVDEEVPA